MSAHSSGPPPFVVKLVMRLAQLLAVSLGGIIATTVITNVWWRLTPTTDMDILVYDQTVPTDVYPSHASLEQIFEYHRIPYDASQDYVGAKPGGLDPHGVWPLEAPEMIILADAYGVYQNAFGDVDEFGSTRRTRVLSLDLVRDVADWVDAGTPAYGEFAMVVDPTPDAAAALLEQTFHFRSTGWTFRVEEQLANVPPAIQSLGPDPWPYEGPGFIAVRVPVAGRAAESELVVLTEDQLTGFYTGVSGGPPGSAGGDSYFDGWFSMVEPTEGGVVDAWFDLAVTDDGAAVLADHGIPTRFPALIRSDNTLYFAGDGLSDETPFRLRRLKGGAIFTRLVTGDEFQFMYQVLEPSIAWLIDSARSNQVAAAD